MSPVPSTPDDSAPWPGPFVRYDLVKELVVALVVMAGLAVILTILFSSPDDSPTTIQSWAKADPGDFLATAVTELNGTSEIANTVLPTTTPPTRRRRSGRSTCRAGPGSRSRSTRRRTT